MKRRMRVILPFLALLTLVGGTLIVHAAQQPDPADPAFLSPVSTDDAGAAALAGMLRERGVEVDRRTSTADALAAARESSTPATIFMPTPMYAHWRTLISEGSVPAGTRLVLVGADGGVLADRDWPVEVGRTRWAAAAVDPACAQHADTGRAALLRHQYTAPGALVCYDGGLVRFTASGYQVTLAGAADPFRNDRIGEHRNAALAVALLAENPRVVWLDLHARDVPPRPSPSPQAPERTGDPSAEETAEPYPGEPGLPGDGEYQEGFPEGPGSPVPVPGDRTGEPREQPAGSLADSPLAQAFPPAFWATALLIVLVAIAFAAAAARRLGTPVAEPLPSRVPAHETMLGHGRLYQRARARGPSLDILREAARRRITRHLGLPPDAGTDRIAAAAGLPAAYVHDVLEDAKPRFDEDLVGLAQGVQELEKAIVEGDTP